MKLSELINQLFIASEFSSANSLAIETNQTQPFIQNMIETNPQKMKESMRKMDIVFDKLTEKITTEELIAAIHLIEMIKQSERAKDILL